MRIPIESWKWFGNSGHFICSDRCRFHMTTLVGEFIVSTVGEMYIEPKAEMEKIGLDRRYETMIFKKDGECGCGCGLPEHNGVNLRMKGFNTAQEATEGHRSLCEWAASDGGQRELQGLYDYEMMRRESR